MDVMGLVVLCVAILIVMLMFYLSAGVVSQDWAASPSYLLRIFAVSLVFVFIVPIVSDLGREQGLSDFMLLLSFVFLVVVVRFVMVEELAVPDDWLASMVISLIGVGLIFVIEEVSTRLFDIGLPSIV